MIRRFSISSVFLMVACSGGSEALELNNPETTSSIVSNGASSEQAAPNGAPDTTQDTSSYTEVAAHESADPGSPKADTDNGAKNAEPKREKLTALSIADALYVIARFF